MCGGKSERVAVAGSETLGVGFRVAAADRTDGMNDVPCKQVAGGRNYGFAGRQALRKTGGAKLAAFFEDARTAATMDAAVHTASPEKTAVGGVYDRVYLLSRDVADEDLDAIIEKVSKGR